MSVTANALGRVLVVDDELGPRESLRMLLKPSYAIQTAENGRTALELLRRFQPDVVIMDIKMPEMDGLELLRHVKRADPSIEVVMITAYASLETVRHALTHGELVVDPERHEVSYAGRRVTLTATEFALLYALVERPGVVFTRAQLMGRAYDTDVHVTERTLDTHVRRIRAKFRALGAEPIETVHGVGYRAAESAPR